MRLIRLPCGRLRSFHGIEDNLGWLAPSKRFGSLLVMGLDVAADLVSELLDAGEDSSMQRTTLQLREPGLDGVEPRGAGGGEVKLDARALLQETLHFGCLVHAAVVQAGATASTSPPKGLAW